MQGIELEPLDGETTLCAQNVQPQKEEKKGKSKKTGGW